MPNEFHYKIPRMENTCIWRLFIDRHAQEEEKEEDDLQSTTTSIYTNAVRIPKAARQTQLPMATREQDTLLLALSPGCLWSLAQIGPGDKAKTNARN